MEVYPLICIINDPKDESHNRCWGNIHTVRHLKSILSNLNMSSKQYTTNQLDSFPEENYMVFPNCYWQNGDTEVLISKILENRKIPYVGGPSDTYKYVSRLLFKQLLSQSGIPTPKYFTIGLNQPFQPSLDNFRKPLVVKTEFGANSKGIYLVSNSDQLNEIIRLGEGSLIVEEWSKSQEYTVCFIGNGEERQFYISEIACVGLFDQLKKQSNMGNYCKPVDDIGIRRALEEITRAVLTEIPINDWGRIDVLYDKKDSEFKVIDVNFLPGLKGFRNPKSLLVSTVEKDAGMNYEELVSFIIGTSLKRNSFYN